MTNGKQVPFRELRTFTLSGQKNSLEIDWKVETEDLWRGVYVLTATKSRDAFAVFDQRGGRKKLIGAGETTDGKSIWNESPIWAFVRGYVWEDAIARELHYGDPQ